MKKRPLCFVACVIFLSGIVASSYVYVIPIFTVGTLGITFILGLVSFGAHLFHQKQLTGWFLRATILFSASFLSFLIAYLGLFSVYSSYEQENREVQYCEGYVLEVEWSSNYQGRYAVYLERLNGEEAGYPVIIDVEYPCALTEQDSFSVEAVFEHWEERDGSFSEERYYLTKGFRGYLLSSEEQEESLIIGEKHPSNWETLFRQWNRKIAQSIDACFPKESELFQAVLLGNQEQLENGQKLVFRRLGIIHMFSISGMHVGILMLGFDFFLRKLYLKKSVRLIFVMFFLWFYAAFTGFSLSCLRAVLMASIFCLSWFCGRRNDKYNSLCFAAIILYTVDPLVMWDTGYLMSVLGTLGCLVASDVERALRKDVPFFTCFPKFLWRIIGSVLFSLFATLAILPVTAVSFGEISWILVIANPLFSIFISFALYTAPVTMIFYAFTGKTWLCWGVDFVANKVMELSRAVSSWDGLTFSVSYSWIPYVLLIAGLVTFFLVFYRLCRRRFLFLPMTGAVLLIAVGIFVAQMHQGEMDRIFLWNHLKNDVLIADSGREVYILDITDGSYSRLSEAAYQARDLNYTEIDGVILTHYHKKYLNSFKRLCENFYIREILLPFPETPEERQIAQSLEDALQEKNKKVSWYIPELGMSLGNLKITFMPRIWKERSVQPMNAFYLEGKDQSLIYVGSGVIEYPEGQRYMQENPAEICVVGSHGMKASSFENEWPALFEKHFFLGEQYEFYGEGVLGNTISEEWYSLLLSEKIHVRKIE